MRLTEAPTAEIRKEIAKFQRAQRRAHMYYEIDHANDIGEKLLAPLFAEMARRQREGQL